ncbi:hypothetical protein C0J52_23642 [Blattella germanica]|nr:hypothetical protein C0J52_23642 [Blattella germanica]
MRKVPIGYINVALDISLFNSPSGKLVRRQRASAASPNVIARARKSCDSSTGHSEKDGKEDNADRPDKKHRSQEKNTSERCSDCSVSNEMEMGRTRKEQPLGQYSNSLGPKTRGEGRKGRPRTRWADEMKRNSGNIWTRIARNPEGPRTISLQQLKTMKAAAIEMDSAEKRPSSSANNVRQESKWEGQWLFVQSGERAKCLVCGHSVIAKKYNVERHYSGRRAFATN